jgi:hypothetical protein
MKLFQKLLLAPAALGLLAPVAATAAEVNINDVAGYARKTPKQIRAVKTAQFSDVVPGDWAYTALQNLSESYGCVDNAYTQNLKSGQALTRYEAAALVNSCLQGGVAAADAGNSDLNRLTNEFGTEMAILKGRVDGLEYKVQELSAGQFSPTSKLSNTVTFNTGYVKDDNLALEDSHLNMTYVFTSDLTTSFTGKDKLVATFETGNMDATAAAGNPIDPFIDEVRGTQLSAANSGNNQVAVDKLWYQWDVADGVTAFVGPAIENTMMLATAPSIYNPVTKQFANGGNASTYNSPTSPGFGIAWTQQKDDSSAPVFSVSSNYTAVNGADAQDPNGGGMLGDGRSKWLNQIAYGSSRWQVSFAMAKNMCDDPTPAVANDAETCQDNSMFSTALGETLTGNQTSYALKGNWSPESSGIIPAVQLGYEWSTIDDDGTNSITTYDGGALGSVEATSSWMMGFTWNDVFADGNTAGIAIGQPEHATDFVDVGFPNHDPANKAFAWEAYYDYQVNDGITITPSIFGFKDRVNGQTLANDGFGGLIQTTFKF